MYIKFLDFKQIEYINPKLIDEASKYLFGCTIHYNKSDRKRYLCFDLTSIPKKLKNKFTKIIKENNLKVIK